MITEAIKKIKDEIDKNKNNPYIQVVGEFLIQYLNKNHEASEKVLQEGKDIGKSLQEMRKAAEKKKVGNCAVLTDQEGFEIVLKYFGIEASADPGTVTMANEIKSPAPEEKEKPKKPDADFDVKLEDFLV